MQISHQHKLIICSQYGNHCRKDSFGEIPGQVVSAFDLMIFWTIKSALILVSGMSLLIVEKFPRAGSQMVREANGQNKSTFKSLLLSMWKHIATLSKTLFRMGKRSFQVAHSISFMVSAIISAVNFVWWLYIHLEFFSWWQWSTYISSIRGIRQSFSKIPQFSSSTVANFLS